MKRYPLMEIKEFLNTTLRIKVFDEDVINIGNYTQFQIVKYLIEHESESVHQKDFENALHIRKSTISGILDTMEKNKIIVRLSSQTDGRGKTVKLSDEFKSRKRKLVEEMKKIEETVVEGISEEDMDTFYKVLQKMRENIEKDGK